MAIISPVRSPVRSPIYAPNASMYGGYGPELVVNGTFNADASGWTDVNATLASVSGKLRATNTGAVNGYGHQSVPTVAGKTYAYACTITGVVAGNVPRVYFSTTINGGQYAIKSGTPLSTVEFTGTFTATGAACIVSCVVNSATAATPAEFDNISIREVL